MAVDENPLPSHPEGEQLVWRDLDVLLFAGTPPGIPPNKGYMYLNNVGRGAFGTGDFDNVISSVSTMNYITDLYNGYRYGGSSLTLERGWSDRNGWHYLELYGWNDRASSVGTW